MLLNDTFHSLSCHAVRLSGVRLSVGESGLGATYDDHLKLIGKRVEDLLLVLIELFSLGVTAEARRANIGSKSAISLPPGPVDPKFQVVESFPTNHSFFQKIRLNDLLYG